MNPLLQPELFLDGAAEADVARFTELLRQHGRLTRHQVARLTGWSERVIRSLAQAAGAEVVRGQAGFVLTTAAGPEETLHTANSFISQGKHMIRYGLALKRRAHQKIG